MGNKMPCCEPPQPVRSELVRAQSDLPSPESLPTIGLRNRERLGDLEADFKKVAGRNKALNAKDLSNVWKRCAQRHIGELGEDDARLIESSANVYHNLIDVDRNGKVSYPEFATFMLGGMEERAQLKHMRGKLRAMVKDHPEMLKALITKFQKWDKDGDGYVTRKEIEKSLDHIRKQGKESTETEEILTEVLEKADVDADDKIDLWEILAYALGRRKVPVELLLYDITSGASRHISPLLLGHNFEAIYHTGLLVFDREYWYGGRIFNNVPPTCVFGPPLKESAELRLQPSYYRPELQVVHLGYTFVNSIEFYRFLSEDLAFKYTPDAYEVLSMNCNSFCEDAARFLTGSGIPTQILELPQRMMASPVAQLLGGPHTLQPLLNKWLGGFGHEDPNTTDHKSMDIQGGDFESVVDEVAREPLSEGTIVVVSGFEIDGAPGRKGAHMVATVTAEEGNFVDVRYFDPSHGAFIAESSVPRGAITQTLWVPRPKRKAKTKKLRKKCVSI